MPTWYPIKPLTPEVITILTSIHYPAIRKWEYSNLSGRSCCLDLTPNQFSLLIIKEMCSSLKGELTIRSWEWEGVVKGFQFTSGCFSSEHRLLIVSIVINPDGKTWRTFRVFNHTVIFTAAIHRVHAPVETDCFETNLRQQVWVSIKQRALWLMFAN